MKHRRILNFICAFVVCAVCFCASTAMKAEAAEKTVVWNGTDGEVLIPGAELKQCTTFVPIRAMLEKIDPECSISWDDGSKTATAVMNGMTLTVTEGKTYIVANGRYLYTGEANYITNGTLMTAIRAIAKACGLTVTWDQNAKKPGLEGSYSPIVSGDRFYNSNDLYWLSRIIYAEAGIEELEGQIAVGNVVLNRVSYSSWPNNIYDVIFDNRVCVQFTPTSTGTIYNEPSSSCVIAAKLALDGADVAGESVYFVNESIARTSWFSRNCTYVATIGRHTFYAS